MPVELAVATHEWQLPLLISQKARVLQGWHASQTPSPSASCPYSRRSELTCTAQPHQTDRQPSTSWHRPASRHHPALADTHGQLSAKSARPAIISPASSAFRYVLISNTTRADVPCASLPIKPPAQHKLTLLGQQRQNTQHCQPPLSLMAARTCKPAYRNCPNNQQRLPLPAHIQHIKGEWHPAHPYHMHHQQLLAAHGHTTMPIL
jgi:hypothetical protein